MRYQYTSQGYKNDFYGPSKTFKINITNLIISLNILIHFFISMMDVADIKNIHLTFAINASDFQLWDLFTYMFLHGDMIHLAFNMFILWMFGNPMEAVWGAKKFLVYYLITGIGSGLIILSLSSPVVTPQGFLQYPWTIGASGAIMAVLFAYGYLYPNRMLLFYFIPMKAKYCILILILMEIVQEIFTNDQISHVGHLGGMFIGFIYLLFSEGKIYNFSFIKVRKKKKSHPENDIDYVDKILDKLKLKGWNGLTDDEKSVLFKASKERKNNQHLN